MKKKTISRTTTMRLVAMLAVLLPLQLSAQVNPKAGYIITNDNDTIRGTVDYRTEKQNAQACLFRADGSQAFTTYRPGDIKGYRLTDNGAFYVTYSFPVNGKDQTFFAEYLLKGGVNLYYYHSADATYYLFEGEDGRTGLLREQDLSGYDVAAARKIRRNELSAVSQVFSKSPDAINSLWETDYNRKTLTRITRQYSEQFCTDSGDCVEFQYDQTKTASITVRPYVEVDYSHGDVSKNSTRSASLFGAAAGCDLLFPRLNKSLIGQVQLHVRYLDKPVDVVYDKLWMLNLKAGVGYCFLSDRRLSPIVRGGLSTSTINKTGFYVGAGADVHLGKNTLRLTATYEHGHYIALKKEQVSLKTSVLNLGVGYVF